MITLLLTDSLFQKPELLAIGIRYQTMIKSNHISSHRAVASILPTIAQIAPIREPAIRHSSFGVTPLLGVIVNPAHELPPSGMTRRFP
jgi:hypothetical protein